MDKAIQAIVNIIKAEVENQIHDQWPLCRVQNVYYGDPKRIWESDLPCIIVQPLDSNNTGRGSRYTQNDINVWIIYVENAKQFYNDSWNAENTVFAVETCVKAVEKTEKNWISKRSIKWILEWNPTLKYQNQKNVELVNWLSTTYDFWNERWYPTIECTTTANITTIWDR